MGKKEKQLDTGRLLELLKDSSEIDDILDKHRDELNAPILRDYLAEQMNRRSQTPSDIILKSNLSKSFLYQILAGERVPSRDILLRLAFVIGLDLDETQRLLTIAQRGILYPKVRRDAALIFSLNKKCSLEQTNDLLCDIGERILA